MGVPARLRLVREAVLRTRQAWQVPLRLWVARGNATKGAESAACVMPTSGVREGDGNTEALWTPPRPLSLVPTFSSGFLDPLGLESPRRANS